MFHTVYNSYESKPGERDYIGKHSTEDPYDGYKGSFVDTDFNPDSKIVMAYAKTAQGASWFEINFHNVFDVVRDPKYANRSKATSTGFDRTGATYSHSEETKQKMSEDREGEKHPLFGKKGEDNPNYGKKRTDETKNQIKEAATGRIHTGETKQKLREANTGERNPNYGKRGEGVTNFGRKWYVNEIGEVQISKEPPGPEWQVGRKWRTVE